MSSKRARSVREINMQFVGRSCLSVAATLTALTDYRRDNTFYDRVLSHLKSGRSPSSLFRYAHTYTSAESFRRDWVSCKRNEHMSFTALRRLCFSRTRAFVKRDLTGRANFGARIAEPISVQLGTVSLAAIHRTGAPPCYEDKANNQLVDMSRPGGYRLLRYKMRFPDGSWVMVPFKGSITNLIDTCHMVEVRWLYAINAHKPVRLPYRILMRYHRAGQFPRE